MGTELTRIESNQKPLELQLLSQKPIVTYLAKGQMQEVARLLPDKIEDAIKGTPIAMLAKAVDIRNIEAFLAIELTKLKSMVNVDDRLNLQPHQIPMIAEELVKTFKNENLADFKICFRNGWMGKYDEKLLRVDAAVIMQWMYKYLDEKYEALEKALKAEKPKEAETEFKGAHVNWLEEWAKIHGIPKADNNEDVNSLERFKLSEAVKARMRRGDYIKDVLVRDGLEVLQKIHSAKDQKDLVCEWDVNGVAIVAATLEEAQEIYIEVYETK